MTAGTDPGQFGAFGKIPSLGDFLRFNLPADFYRRWDEWLQAGMLAMRTHLGERWDDCYLSAPIWRFSLPAGMAGRRAVSGIVMASVDQVGRRYPLTLAAPDASDDTPLRHFANAGTFERLEEIALATLEEETRRDALGDQLAPLSLTRPQIRERAGESYAGNVAPEQVFAARHIARIAGDVAVWTAELEDGHRMLLSPDLPDTAQFIGLFDMSAPLWQSAAEGAGA